MHAGPRGLTGRVGAGAGEEEGGLLMLLPEDDDEESAGEKRECDRVLEEGTQLWWDKIGGLR